jgi:hypothetical protein
MSHEGKHIGDRLRWFLVDRYRLVCAGGEAALDEAPRACV